MSTATTPSRIVTLRVPERLERQLEAAAQRDGNPLSATIRRLICAGLRAESEATADPW
jgi:hypothetical protein